MDHAPDFESALNAAIEHYNNTMDREFENIRRETIENITNGNFENSNTELHGTLQQLHEKVQKQVIDSITQKHPHLTPENEAQLYSALAIPLENYKERLQLLLASNLGPVLGIDLGTTFCCVAVYHEGEVKIVRNSMGQTTTPSYVAFDDKDDLTIGQQAKDEANIHPESTIFDAKRLIGRKFDHKIVQQDIKLWPFHVVSDAQNNPKIKVNSTSFYPEEVSAKLLAFLKEEAEEFLGGLQITDAVITVPAYFNNGQRQATKDAGKLAGLNVLQILNEPTAAAITYSLHKVQLLKKNVLIFDLGGGTFDVSILTVEKGQVKILAVGGDTHLGGEDFDSLMVNYCIQDFFRREGVDLADGKDSDHPPTRFKVNKRLRRLRNECEKQKIFLSSSRKVTVALDTIDGTRDLVVEFSREKFESLIQSKLDQCIQTVDDVINEIPNFKKQDIHDIVLVGGSTHIPKIQQMLRDYFDGKALSKSINPDEAVAYGAAVLARLLSGNAVNDRFKHPIEISDVTSLSLGIEIHEGDFSKIVPKNTKIPFQITRRYTTRSDYQSTVTVAIFEGEDELTKNNHLLGKFTLSNIPLAKARQEKCHVTMIINCEGILTVEASSVSNVFNQTGIKISMHNGRPKHSFV